MAQTSAPVEVRITDLQPIKRLIAGAEKMATYEHAGGDGWWAGWAEVRAALIELRGERKPGLIVRRAGGGWGVFDRATGTKVSPPRLNSWWPNKRQAMAAKSGLDAATDEPGVAAPTGQEQA